MKQNIFAFFILLFYVVMVVLSEFPYLLENFSFNPNDYARITDVSYKAVLVDEPNSKGKVVITERLTFDIHAASEDNLFWELWRDLPEDYVDGQKVEYKVNSVKQIYEDGREFYYAESPKLYWDDYDYVRSNTKYGPGKWFHSKGPYSEANERYECVFFYVDGLYREKVVFEIEYEMYNAALRYNDCSELYLSLYSEGTIKHLKSYKGQILIPDKDMPSEGNYKAYTYGTNSHDFPFTESKMTNLGYHTFSFELNEEQLKFKPYNQYIEFALVSYGPDRHLFTDYAPNNMYSYDNVLDEIWDEQLQYQTMPEMFRKIKYAVLIGSFVVTLFIIIRCLNTDKRMKKRHNFFEPTQKIDYFREIPNKLDPNFAANLVFSKEKLPKDESNRYAAIMLSLVHKGYIELYRMDESKDWYPHNVRIKVKYQPYSNNIPQEAFDIFDMQMPQNIQTDVNMNSNSTLNTALGTSQNVNQSSSNDINDLRNKILEARSLNSDNIIIRVEDNQNNINAVNNLNNENNLNYINNINSQDNLYNVNYTNEEKLEPLTPSEEHYFNLILRYSKGQDITMQLFQVRVSMDYENTDSFVKNIEKSIIDIGINQGYLQKLDYTKPKQEILKEAKSYKIWALVSLIGFNLFSCLTRLDFAFGAYTILGIGLFCCSLYLNKISEKYVLLTQYGEDEYQKWRGLYNFLNSDTLIHERTVIELALWEEYLVYATAFGLSEKVIAALKIRCPELQASPMLNSTYYRSSYFRINSRSFGSATRSASFTARGGGSFSYGGGGRGGGGGGGGH